MNRKTILKLAVDALMTAGLLFLMGYHLWGDAAHEWAGAGMFALFLVHHGLNAGWWRGLFKGKYTPTRVLCLAVDLLTLAAMLGLMVSGVILSRHVFAFLPIRGGTAFARILHMASAYWGFVLMAAHLGLHWGMLTGMVRKKCESRPPFPPVIPGAILAIYGAVVFFKRKLPEYLFLRTQFVFLDFGESKLLFYLDYLAMMGTFVFLSHCAIKLLRKSKERKAP